MITPTTKKITKIFEDLHAKVNKASCRYFSGHPTKAVFNLKRLLHKSLSAIKQIEGRPGEGFDIRIVKRTKRRNPRKVHRLKAE